MVCCKNTERTRRAGLRMGPMGCWGEGKTRQPAPPPTLEGEMRWSHKVWEAGEARTMQAEQWL